MCEVDPEVPCGWVRIYERLASLERADRLRDMPALRDHRTMLPDGERRRASLWALELTAPETVNEES